MSSGLLLYGANGFVGDAIARMAVQRGLKPTAAARAATRMDVWGQVEDDAGGRATARLHGPEGGVEWTGLAALAVVRRVLAGEAPEGFQTPARAYGPDLVMECDGVTREDVD